MGSPGSRKAGHKPRSSEPIEAPRSQRLEKNKGSRQSRANRQEARSEINSPSREYRGTESPETTGKQHNTPQSWDLAATAKTHPRCGNLLLYSFAQLMSQCFF